VTQEVLAALDENRTAATIPCKLKIPPPPAGQTLNLQQINVVYTTSTCQTRVIPYRDAQASCDGAIGGWYFDDVAAPQSVVLCSRSCGDVSAPGGNLLFSIGCGRYSIH